jgi:hypothetical protein
MPLGNLTRRAQPFPRTGCTLGVRLDSSARGERCPRRSAARALPGHVESHRWTALTGLTPTEYGPVFLDAPSHLPVPGRR